MTLDINPRQLTRVMKLLGAKTRDEAVDRALAEAERAARRVRLLRHPLPDNLYANAVTDGYDVMELREAEKPPRHAAR